MKDSIHEQTTVNETEFNWRRLGKNDLRIIKMRPEWKTLSVTTKLLSLGPGEVDQRSAVGYAQKLDFSRSG